jgi:hypothetical protein
MFQLFKMETSSKYFIDLLLRQVEQLKMSEEKTPFVSMVGKLPFVD